MGGVQRGMERDGTEAGNMGGKGKDGDLVSSSEIAKLIGKTVKTVQDLTNNGVLPAEEQQNGKRVLRKYDKYMAIQAYIRHVEERAAKKNGGGKEQEKNQVEVDIKRTKLRMAELQLEELEGKVHLAEDVESFTDDLVLCVRANLLAMPGRLAVPLAEMGDASEVSSRIHEEVCAILEDLAGYEYDPKEYKKRARERQGWFGNVQGEEEGWAEKGKQPERLHKKINKKVPAAGKDIRVGMGGQA